MSRRQVLREREILAGVLVVDRRAVEVTSVAAEDEQRRQRQNQQRRRQPAARPRYDAGETFAGHNHRSFADFSAFGLDIPDAGAPGRVDVRLKTDDFRRGNSRFLPPSIPLPNPVIPLFPNPVIPAKAGIQSPRTT